jgi:hypothetical protein
MAEGARERSTPWVVAAFVALAILTGPVGGYTVDVLDSAMGGQRWAAGALSSLLAGLGLLLVSAIRRQRMLSGREWLAILLLAAPQWLGVLLTAHYVGRVPGLHAAPRGVVFLLGLAAPLWLGLLSALEVVSVEAPRAVMGAAIAGMGAVCLVVPTYSYSVTAGQIPVVLLQLLLSVLVVWTWAMARPRLGSAGTFAAAGAYLLLSALGDAGFWLASERATWQPADWRAAALLLAIQAVVLMASWRLWFWLLQRMTLAAFGMGALAGWTASVVLAILFIGVRQWRIDVGLVVAVGAIVVALRARLSEEEPVGLGLGGG